MKCCNVGAALLPDQAKIGALMTSETGGKISVSACALGISLSGTKDFSKKINTPRLLHSTPAVA